MGAYLKSFFNNFLLLSEFTFTKRDIKNTETNFNQEALYLKASYFLKDYWEVYLSYEKLQQRDFGAPEPREKTSFGNLFKLVENCSLLLEMKLEDKNKLYIGQVFLNLW